MDRNKPTIALGDANRAMVFLVLGNLLAWLAGVPLVLFVFQGNPEWLKYAVIGAALAPCIVLFYYFVRVFLWMFIFSFWYALGCFASAGLLLFTFLAALLLTGRLTSAAFRTGPPARVDDTFVVAALIFLLVVGLGMLVLMSLPRRSPQPKLEESPLPVVERAELPMPKPLTYLEHRENKTP